MCFSPQGFLNLETFSEQQHMQTKIYDSHDLETHKQEGLHRDKIRKAYSLRTAIKPFIDCRGWSERSRLDDRRAAFGAPA